MPEHFIEHGIGETRVVMVEGNAIVEARILRGQALSLKNRDFVQAAKVAGESTWRIVFGELMPNMISRIAAAFVLASVVPVYFEAAAVIVTLVLVGQVLTGDGSPIAGAELDVWQNGDNDSLGVAKEKVDRIKIVLDSTGWPTSPRSTRSPATVVKTGASSDSPMQPSAPVSPTARPPAAPIAATSAVLLRPDGSGTSARAS